MNNGIPEDPQDRGTWTSASYAEQDSLCPGAHMAQLGINPVPWNKRDADDSEFGTRVHQALAIGDSSKLNLDERDIYESCLMIERKVLIKYFGPEVAGLKATPIAERRVWLGFQARNEMDPPDAPPATLYHSGKPDRVFRRGGKVLIIDFKTLAGEVEVSPRNLQLRDYMTLIWNRAIQAGHRTEEIAVCVIQPLATHDPVLCIYKPEDYDTSLKLLFDRVITSNNIKSPRIAGEVQCRFCRAKPHCAEHAKWSGEHVPQLSGSPLIDVPMAKWSPEQRARVAAALPVISKWVTDAQEFIKQTLRQDPEGVPGFVLGEGRVIPECTDPAELAARFYKLGGTEQAFIRCVTVGKTKFAEEVSKVTGATGAPLEGALRALYKGIVKEKRASGAIIPKSIDQ